MRKLLGVAVVAALVVGLPAAAGAPRAPSRAQPPQRVDVSSLRPRVAPGELIVEFNRGIAPADARRAVAARGATVTRHLPALSASVVRVAQGVPVSRAVAALTASPLIARVERNKLIYPAQVIPNDPEFDDLWGLRNVGQAHITSPLESGGSPGTRSGKEDADIDATEAWNVETGTSDTVIAVLDSGVDVSHPDLAASIWKNPGEIPNNGDDDDGNGYVDDVHGWDFAQRDNTVLEPNASIEGREHGTHVAGVIAAQMNNGVGVAGVCPGCKIMVLKFMRPLNGVMVGDLASELRALDYAIRMGADILNASFTTPLWSGLERRAYLNLQNAGTLTVAAAGNASLDNDMLLGTDFDGDGYPDDFSPAYPASYNLPGIVSVAASNDRDEYGYFSACPSVAPRWRCAFTNWGHDSVDLAAPGVDILSAIPGGRYAPFDGTSMAAPYVSGVAGLIRAAHPQYSAAQVKNAIMNSVGRPDSLKKLFALRTGPVYGRFTRTSGRANAERALVLDNTVNATPLTDGNISGAKLMQRVARGWIGWPADVNDVYKKWLLAGRRYRVTLNGPTGNDYDLVVWRRKTLEIWQIEDGCFPGGVGSCQLLRYAQTRKTADETATFTAKKAGFFFFHVTAWLRNSGFYTLRVRQLPLVKKR